MALQNSRVPKSKDLGPGMLGSQDWDPVPKFLRYAAKDIQKMIVREMFAMFCKIEIVPRFLEVSEIFRRARTHSDPTHSDSFGPIDNAYIEKYRHQT